MFRLGFGKILMPLSASAHDKVWARCGTWIPTLCGSSRLRAAKESTSEKSWEENPVNLLITHSSNQAKLACLVTFFGCRYDDGRPSSAPQLRRGVPTKVTMAQAAGGVRAVTGGNAEDLNHIPPRMLQGTARQYAIVLEGNPGTT